MNDETRRLAVATATERLGGGWRIEEVRRDGSDRRYVRLADDSGRRVMAMVWPAERTGGEIGSAADPAQMVLTVTQHLADAGLPVPQLLGASDDLRVLLLEDLGNRHLADLFADGIPQERYQEALEQLHRFQVAPFPADSPIRTRVYETDLWYWEFEHFREWGVERRTRITLPAHVTESVQQTFRELSIRLASARPVPVHRDYHCRNLMIDLNGHLRWIDYQDALTGHPFYDPASLLWDAYVELPDHLRIALFMEWFAEAPAPVRQAFADAEDAEAELVLVAAHRMLKAAGRFVLFVQQKGLDHFAAHIPDLLRRVERIAHQYRERLPLFGRVVEPLRPYVPEWRSAE